MFLLYRSEKTVPTCVYCMCSPLFTCRASHLNRKNAEFASLSHVEAKDIDDNMCHTDLREVFTWNLFLVISGSWLISGADMGC